MEFGYTIPLQKHIRMELPPSKSAAESFFCWAIHMLTVQGRKAVLAMNCASRYCVLLYGMRAEDWTHLPWIIEREISAAILREGFSEFKSTRYFALGGPLKTCAAQGWGNSPDFDVTPHRLRHTCITNLIAASVDPKTAQYLAGHENSKTAMGIYAKVKYNKPSELAPVANSAFIRAAGA